VTTFLAETNVGYKRVQPGDLVMNTMWVWMGALGVTSLPGIVSPAYSVYRVQDDRVLPSYADLLYRSRAYVAEMTRRSTGVWSSRLRLYSDRFLAMSVAFPPLAHQRAVVERADRASALTAGLAASYKALGLALTEYRDALITEAVTGKLDVTRLSEQQMDESAQAAMEGESPEVLST